MRWQVYAVFDSKVGAYTAPFNLRTRGEAIRSFEDACRDDKLPFKVHGGDYRLFFLGEFDDNTGTYLNVPNGPEPVIGADEI